MGCLARGATQEEFDTFKQLKKRGRARLGRSVRIVKPASEKFFAFPIAFERSLRNLGHASIQ
ncbi:MAG: hypothetical protein EAZ81_03075 [Verrucomicrobia bacterium]|jgi:hypothetical protein|nr:MAG: hypothetical protein EAZ81_03075 [Verrucomicrobiota bacterium]